MSKRALTVDDSKTMRDMVSFTLKNAGFDVTEAEDGKDALNKLSGQKFDVVITDLNMPNMNGFELTCLPRRISRIASTCSRMFRRNGPS